MKSIFLSLLILAPIISNASTLTEEGGSGSLIFSENSAQSSAASSGSDQKIIKQAKADVVTYVETGKLTPLLASTIARVISESSAPLSVEEAITEIMKL